MKAENSYIDNPYSFRMLIALIKRPRMRTYNNQPSHYDITGFQSACAEFSENQLSLDERFNIGNPSVRIFEITENKPHLGLYKGDALVVDQSLRPRFKDLIIVDGDVYRVGSMTELQDVQIQGVVTATFTNPNSEERKNAFHN